MAEVTTNLSIGQVAERTGLSVHTLRFYEHEGIFANPLRRGPGGRRVPPGRRRVAGRLHHPAHRRHASSAIRRVVGPIRTVPRPRRRVDPRGDAPGNLHWAAQGDAGAGRENLTRFTFSWSPGTGSARAARACGVRAVRRWPRCPHCRPTRPRHLIAPLAVALAPALRVPHMRVRRFAATTGGTAALTVCTPHHQWRGRRAPDRRRLARHGGSRSPGEIQAAGGPVVGRSTISPEPNRGRQPRTVGLCASAMGRRPTDCVSPSWKKETVIDESATVTSRGGTTIAAKAGSSPEDGTGARRRGHVSGIEELAVYEHRLDHLRLARGRRPAWQSIRSDAAGR